MSRDKEGEKSADGSTPNSEGLKRRDLLLSGTLLMAASALTAQVLRLRRKRSNRHGLRRAGNSRTSSSSWAMTSAGRISVSTIKASCPAARPIWTRWPTRVCASPTITPKRVGDTTFKVYLDGYNQLDLITGKAPSARHEIFYLTESTLAAVRVNDYKYRFTDQPGGWLGPTVKVDWPILTNLRLDPYERTGMFNGKDNGSIAYYNWFAFEFWRFVFVQQVVGKAAQTLVDFPPMQGGASFNMSAVKAQIDKAIAERAVGK